MPVVGMFGAEVMLSSTGVPLASTPVTILTVPGGANATVYTDLTGTTGGTGSPYNPVMTSTAGNLTFYAVPAQYDLQIAGVTVARVIVDVTGQSVGTVGGPAGPLTSSGLVPLSQLPTVTTALQIFNVKASPYNATGNGTTDDTTAITNANADAHTYGGTVYFPPGTYKTSSTFTISKPTVSWLGAGSANSMIQPTNNGDCVRLQMATFIAAEQVGSLKSLTIDGTYAAASSCGFHFGDAMNGAMDDLVVQNFTGGSAIGIHADNVTNYTEGWDWGRVYVPNCTTGVLFDVKGGGTYSSANSSFGYTRIHHLRIDSNSAQVGVTLRNGALIYNSLVSISANLSSGSTLMQVQGITGTGDTGIAKCLYAIQAEVTGGGSASGIILSQYAQMTGAGVVDLSSGTITSSVSGPTNPGAFYLSGWIYLGSGTATALFTDTPQGQMAGSATSGSASALPATPANYKYEIVGGTTYKIPLYNV